MADVTHYDGTWVESIAPMFNVISEDAEGFSITYWWKIFAAMKHRFIYRCQEVSAVNGKYTLFTSNPEI